MHPRPHSSPPLRRSLIAMVLACAALTGCSIEKYLSADNPIYTGATVELVNPDKAAPDEATLQSALEGLIDVESTDERGAYWHFKLDTTEKKGFIRRKLRGALAAEPVYYDEGPLLRTELVMRDYLKDRGYFGSDIEFDTIRADSYRVEAVFRVQTEGRSVIDTLVLPADSIDFVDFIEQQAEGSLIKQGDYYSIAALGAERVRIDQLAGREGYFELAPSNVYYYVDSTAGPERVKVWMKLDRGSDSLALSRFRIGETYVFPEYTLGDTLPRDLDTVKFEHIQVIESTSPSVHPEVLARRIGLKYGDLYDRQIYENTVNQLLDLGVFKYVNYRLERRATDSIPTLDQYIYLTQSQSRDISVDVEATTQAQSPFGFGVQTRYADRNFFGGAEDFNVSLGVAAGPQPGFVKVDTTVLAQEYNFDASLALPRIVGPFAKELERRAFYIPRTVANVRYQITNRPDFTLSNAGLRLGYRYRPNKLVSHALYPVSFSYTSLLGESMAFDSVLAIRPQLNASFADNAIAGAEYEFNYNEQSTAGGRSYWYVDAGIRTSGGLTSLIAQSNAEGGPKQLGGVALSQFIKARIDGRRTFVLGGGTRFATRAIVGAALPFGDSETIPFVEQFFAGGPNSIRAFPIRGIGPGNTIPGFIDSANISQSGDIRLELNAEYRFPIWSFLEGAAFVDAGNIWLVNDISGKPPEDPLRDGVFRFDSFFNELAVGTGLGLRLNFDVIVIRIDGAVPIRKPWLPISDAFEFQNVNVFDADNRAENFRIHFGIGYPF